MKKSSKFSPEIRERAVRMVQEHRGEYPSLWAAIESIAAKKVAARCSNSEPTGSRKSRVAPSKGSGLRDDSLSIFLSALSSRVPSLLHQSKRQGSAQGGSLRTVATECYDLPDRPPHQF